MLGQHATRRHPLCCGRFADYLGQDQPFDFSQEDMPKFRRRVAAEVLAKRLQL